jgi:hypothetical protein
MTYPAPEKPPRDEWFDDYYLPELGDPPPPHPYDDWPNAKDFENPRPEEEIADELTMHEKMYRIATQKHSPWKGGGSENFQGGSENVL